MKAMFAALLAIVVISFGANMYLNGPGNSASERATGDSVRLD